MTTSEMGSQNRTRGLVAERQLAAYLRRWWPEAVRAIRTKTSAAPDPGDIANVPFLVSLKDAKDVRVSSWWQDLQEMSGQGPRLLVHKRRGKAEPRYWWCYLDVTTLRSLVGAPGINTEDGADLVCCELGTVIGWILEGRLT